MSAEASTTAPKGLPDRLRRAGWLIAGGLILALPTLFWNHSVSFFLFLCGSGVLTLTGIGIYLYAIARQPGNSPP